MDSTATDAPAHTKRSLRRRVIPPVIGLVFLLALAAGLLVTNRLQDQKINVPASIVRRVSFPIYLPQELPGNYTLREDSFIIQDEVLIFKASDDTGASIIFTEQHRPKDFNFDELYQTQFKEAKTLNDVPYPSVLAKTKYDNSKPLSIVTKETWIIANTQSPLDENDMHIVAKGMKRY